MDIKSSAVISTILSHFSCLGPLALVSKAAVYIMKCLERLTFSFYCSKSVQNQVHRPIFSQREISKLDMAYAYALKPKPQEVVRAHVLVDFIASAFVLKISFVSVTQILEKNKHKNKWLLCTSTTCPCF